MEQDLIQYYALSDMGRQRTNNEDAKVADLLDEHTVLAVAIDGVGGYEGGEVAAEIAQTEIPGYLHRFRNGERIELLKQAVVCANNAIYERRQTDDKRPNMSCVLTSALIDTKRKVVTMVHIGDTRMYQFRHGELVKLSHDHSLIGYREEVGDLTEEQAMHHPQRNIISRDVGSAMHETDDRDFIEAAEFPLLPNSTFLLCSDGLTDLVTSQQIKEILMRKASLEQKAQALVNAANDAGGKDNITVVLVQYTAKEETVSSQPSAISHQTSDVRRPNEEKTMPKKSMTAILLVAAFSILVGIAIGAYVFMQIGNSPKTKVERQETNVEDADSTQKQDTTPTIDTTDNRIELRREELVALRQQISDSILQLQIQLDVIDKQLEALDETPEHEDAPEEDDPEEETQTEDIQ